MERFLFLNQTIDIHAQVQRYLVFLNTALHFSHVFFHRLIAGLEVLDGKGTALSPRYGGIDFFALWKRVNNPLEDTFSFFQDNITQSQLGLASWGIALVHATSMPSGWRSCCFSETPLSVILTSFDWKL